MKRTISFGAGAMVAYLVAAWVTFGNGVLPVRPFFDGPHTPQPYRWVTYPEGEVSVGAPLPGTTTVKMTKEGNEQNVAATDDTQLQLSVPAEIIAPRAGQHSVRFDLAQTDPDKIGPPPDGTSYNGNAYNVIATYLPSGSPAEFLAGDTCPEPTPSVPQQCLTVIARYAYILPGLEMYRRSGPDWVPMLAEDSSGTSSIYGDSPVAGTFVVTGIGGAKSASRVTDYIAIALGVLAVAVGIAVSRSHRDRKRREMIARARGKKMKKPKGKAPR